MDENHPQAADNSFSTIEEAMAFLKDAARNKANLKNFQTVWQQTNPKRKNVSQHQEKNQMLRGLADRLLDGRLRVRKQRSSLGGVTSFAEAAAAFRPQKQTWSGGANLKIRDRPDPAPAPPPEAPMNVKQQVAALKRAAESGAPFCERCNDQKQ